MKKYIGTKQIEAEPCTLGNYYKETGKSPYGKDIEGHEETEEGYKVKYEDGYISWSPKDIFDKVYKVADTFVDRLKIELTELSDKQDKLNKFFETKMFKDLSITDEHLLRAQFGAMLAYSSILMERVANAEYEWECTWKIVMPDEHKSTDQTSTNEVNINKD